MRFLLCFIIFLFILHNISAQNTDDCKRISLEINNVNSQFSKLALDDVIRTVDSLENLVPSECPKARMLIYINRGRVDMLNGSNLTAKEKFNKAYSIASEIKSAISQKYILEQLSFLVAKDLDEDKAISLLDSAFNIPCHVDSIDCLKFNVRNKLNLAVSQINKGEVTEAMETYLFADSLIQLYQIKDSIYRVSIFNQLGNICKDQMSDSRRSLNFYLQAMKYCPVKHSARFLLNNNIAARYTNLSVFDSAKMYISKTIDNTDVPRYLIISYQVLGDIAIKKKDFEQARIEYSQALKYSISNGDDSYTLVSQALLAKSLFLLNRYREADEIFVELMSRYAEEGLSKTVESNEMERFYNLNKIALKDPVIAENTYKYMMISDSIKNVSRIAFMDNSIASYEKKILKDSLKVERLTKENEISRLKNYRLTTLSLILALLLLASIARLLFKRWKSQKVENTALIFRNEELQKLNANLQNQNKNSLLNINEVLGSKNLELKSTDKIHFIPFKSIKYINAEDNGVRVYYNDTSKWSNISLKDIMNDLPKDYFIKIYRSTIVNVLFIDWVNHLSLQLKDGKELKIGRTFKQNIQQILNNKS